MAVASKGSSEKFTGRTYFGRKSSGFDSTAGDGEKMRIGMNHLRRRRD
jgi:hypothetical protein